jgi:hypothetical protein
MPGTGDALELSHSCGRPVDSAVDDSSDSTLTGTDEVHRLWI